MSIIDETSTDLENRLRACMPAEVDYASVRFSESRTEQLSVRAGVVEPVRN